MRLVKREKTSGLIVAFVETEALTEDERVALSDELHELVVDTKCGEASAITDRGIEAQLQYLITLRGEDALTDRVLDTLDAADNWRSWR
ncbi:MAG: hypothetical protein HYX77_04910 [Acidobacteria bacterium]|nr:hypothetical protein [Acidobacteriota bacterium]